MKNHWNFFDAIYCINLERDIKKYENVKIIFQHLEIPVIFFKGCEDYISNRGCLESHKAIYNLSLEKGFQNVLIFEDDIIPTKEITSEKIKLCIDFMKTYPWDIFYFGAVPSILNYSNIKSPVNNIYKIRGICTHAYALNRSALEKLKDIKYLPESPLDYTLRNDETLESYAVYPSFFYQKTGFNLPENIITLGLRANEFYAYNIGFPAKYVIIILLIIIAIFIWWKFLKKDK